MPQQFSIVDLENMRTFLSRLSPAGFADQQVLVNLVSKIDSHIAKGKSNGTRRHHQSGAAA